MTTTTNSSAKLTIAKTFDIITNAYNKGITLDVSASELYPDLADQLPAKLEKMNASAHKVSEKPNGPSKVRLENEKIAAELEKYWTAHSDVILTLKDITTKVDFITSTQKAANIVNILLESGKVERAEKKISGHMAYKFVA